MGFDPGSQFAMQLISQLGQQIGQGRQQAQEQQILDQLLPQLQQAESPEDILKGILQLQGAEGISSETKQRFANLAGPFSQVTKSREQAELRQQLLQQKISELDEKKELEFRKKTVPLQSAFERVNRMRDLLSKGNLGRGSGFVGFFGGETARDKATFEQLGKSLISLATTIPIRNRLEFETLAGQLIDATQPAAALEGTLDAMESIISDSLSEFLPKEQQKEFNQQASGLNVQTPQGQQQITLQDIKAERERRKKK